MSTSSPSDVTSHRTALITGATSGIGAEFASQIAAQGRHLILVARDAERLAAKCHEVESQYSIHAEGLVADLLTEEGQASVEARLRSHVDPVELLVNNAGHGLGASFEKTTWEQERDHWRIHTEVPLRFCHAALSAMLTRGGGRIINVASAAAFTPRGTYSAAKLAMVNFSEWANLHYAASGIGVTALCPGLTRTEFHERSGQDTSKFPRVGWLKAENVVRQALLDSAAGRARSTPSLRYKAARIIGAVLPQRTVERVVDR
jgi:short-subunit dehydrogenase